MKASTKRSIIRWIHLVFGLTLVGYIFGPPEETQQYLPFFRYFYLPVVMVSGLWMWKGAAIKRMFGRSSGQSDG